VAKRCVFPKGNTFGGMKRQTEEQKEVRRKLKLLDGKLLLGKYCYMDYFELKERIEKREGTVLEIMIMRVIERGITTADYQILNWIYTRLGLLSDDDPDKSISVNYSVITPEIRKIAKDNHPETST
jgi:hypothetical protein